MKKCRQCSNSDIYYDRNITAGSVGELRVCNHIEKQCSCGAIPPYQVFDEHGNPSWCPCRSARLKLGATKKAFRERDSQIPKKFRWKFIMDFKTPNDNAKKLRGKFISYLDKTPDQPWTQGYYFWGPTTGTGKTLLACIMLQELMVKYGVSGKYIDLSRQFFQRLKSSYNIDDESYGEAGKILDELIKIPFLIIDDFGVQRNTEWELEMLYNLIDSRYSEERPTIITSNINIENYRDNAHGQEIAHKRIYSRIIEMCEKVYFDLEDYRIKDKQTVEP